MKYAIELHARDRKVVQCEAFDKVGSNVQVVIKKGILMGFNKGMVQVSIPTANATLHTFSLVDSEGYGYEGSMHAKRGWRIKLAQLKDAEIPVEYLPTSVASTAPEGPPIPIPPKVLTPTVLEL